MVLEKFWIRRRWLDGRFGHSLYLMFGLTFANFLLIAYRFLIKEESMFDDFIGNLWIFAIFFILSYIPFSIIIGHWHNRTQLKVENYLKRMEDPLLATMFRTILDIETKNISDEEILKFKGQLDKILNEKN